MSITAEQIRDQVNKSINVLEKLSAKEREKNPSPSFIIHHSSFIINYKNILSLAKEAMPSTDSRRWPPAATEQPSSQMQYIELYSFLAQILAILAEGIEPTKPFY